MKVVKKIALFLLKVVYKVCEALSDVFTVLSAILGKLYYEWSKE